jgi:hypothetical protein
MLQSCLGFGRNLPLVYENIKKTKHFSHTKIFNGLIDCLISGKISKSGSYHQSVAEIARQLWAIRLRQLVAMG